MSFPSCVSSQNMHSEWRNMTAKVVWRTTGRPTLGLTSFILLKICFFVIRKWAVCQKKGSLRAYLVGWNLFTASNISNYIFTWQNYINVTNETNSESLFDALKQPTHLSFRLKSSLHANPFLTVWGCTAFLVLLNRLTVLVVWRRKVLDYWHSNILAI